MRALHPTLLIVIGGVLVFLGFLLPFLIVIGLLPSTFALNFSAYAASIAGLFVGLIGVALARGRGRS